MARFAKIGVGAGKTFDASKLSPEMKTAIEQGMADAWVAFAGLKKEFEEGKVSSGDVFGTRAVSEEQLSLPHGGCRSRHLRQFEAGGDVSGLLRGCDEAEAGRRQPLHACALRRASCRPSTRSGR